MLSETFTVYSKYSYNLFILSNERLIFFRKNGDELNYEHFFDYYERKLRTIKWGIRSKYG